MFKWLIGESKAERTPLQKLSDERAERAMETEKDDMPFLEPNMVTLTCFGEFGFSYNPDKLVEKERWYHSCGQAVHKKVEVAVLYADYNVRYTVGDDLNEYVVSGQIEVADGLEEFRVYELMCEEIENGAMRIMRLIQDEVKKHFNDISKNERLIEMKEIVKKNPKISIEFNMEARK